MLSEIACGLVHGSIIHYSLHVPVIVVFHTCLIPCFICGHCDIPGGVSSALLAHTHAKCGRARTAATKINK